VVAHDGVSLCGRPVTGGWADIDWDAPRPGGTDVKRSQGQVRTSSARLAFVDALVGERHNDFKSYRSHQAWAPWFYNIAWDVTWVLIDARNAAVSLLCVTDTD
jgi:hypothetical protein